MANAQKMMSIARSLLVLEQPFFASLLLPMPISEDKTIPTLCTDGDSVQYNPDFIESLTQKEVLFALAHETLHCVFDHMGRRENRTPNRWNQAADYVINDILDKEGFTVIKGCLLDPALVLKGKGTTEGVYTLLPASSENKGAGQKGGSFDQVLDAGSDMGKKKPDAATKAQKSAEMKVRVLQAKNAAKMQGALSAGMERLVDEFTKPKIDWRETLRRYISEKAKVEYTYARPKRRFAGEDFILPSLGGEKMGIVTVAVDCSGSVDKTLLTKFASEINAIKQDVFPARIDVVYFDSRVCHVESFEDEQEVRISAHGGGGTRFSPVFKHINEQPELPVACVFLTDLYCSDYGPPPEYPVLWAVLEGKFKSEDVPFGEICEVSADDEQQN